MVLLKPLSTLLCPQSRSKISGIETELGQACSMSILMVKRIKRVGSHKWHPSRIMWKRERTISKGNNAEGKEMKSYIPH